MALSSAEAPLGIPIKIAIIEKQKARGGRWEDGKGGSLSSLFPIPIVPRSPLRRREGKDGEFYANLTKLCSCFRTQGATVDPKSDERHTPLFRAADKGAADVVKLLMDHGADVTIRDTELQSVLHAAVGHPRAMEVLLQVRLPHRKTSSMPWGHPRAMESLLTADKE